MPSRYSFLPIAFVTTALLMLGCSGGSSPTQPGFNQPSSSERVSQNPTGRVLWGLWQVSIEKDTGALEVVPIRGASFNCNVTSFLQPPKSPVHLLKIGLLPGSDLPSGYVEVDVTLLHPFPGLNQYRGFDVRGIFMADGTHVSDHNPAIVYGDANQNEAHMLNADGYTRWWNATEFTDSFKLFGFHPGKLGPDLDPAATLNPYKYYADDVPNDGDVAEMYTANRGVFSPAGPTHTRLYKIQFSVVSDTPLFIFNYAVDASWYEPDPSGAPDYPIESFPPEAQCQEAYHLSVNTLDSTVWYEDGDFGGELHIALEVFDWQGAVSPSGVPGEVASIWVESSILTHPVDILPMAAASGGSQPTSSVFEADLGGSYLDLAAGGEYPILICVESASPNTYQPQIEGGEVFIYPEGALAAYAFGIATVTGEQPCEPAEDVTGDVTLAVHRNGSQGIDGLVLAWDGNGSPYYAIYADDDPYDALNPTIFVTEVSTTTAMIDIGCWPDFSTTGAYAFGVKGRTVSGEPECESINMSQLAFCEMEDFDGGTNPAPWVYGYRNEAYKWEETTPGQIDGSTSIRHNPVCPTGQWAVVASEVIPEIPDSETAFLEFAHIASFNGWLAAYKELSGGFTHSVPPTGPATYFDYDSTQDFWAIMDDTWDWVPPAMGPPPGGGWIGLIERFDWNKPSYTFFGWRFSDCPHGTAQITRMAFPDFIEDAGTIRAAMAWVTNTWTNNSDWMEVDEIAVVIY